jgi:XTP/dITP diphosphohydrolase
MTDLQLVCASANPDKVAEIAAILGDEVVLLPRPPDVPDVVEDALTLEGNARLKAEALAAATGLPAVADDTGLEVDALDGRPGVWSARYAGDDATYDENVAKLLHELKEVAQLDRTASFRTVAIVVWPDGREVVAEGVCAGLIAVEASGTRGFGYDPVFMPADGDGRTFADMTAAEKHAVSHRGRAFRALAEKLSAMSA